MSDLSDNPTLETLLSDLTKHTHSIWTDTKIIVNLADIIIYILTCGRKKNRFRHRYLKPQQISSKFLEREKNFKTPCVNDHLCHISLVGSFQEYSKIVVNLADTIIYILTCGRKKSRFRRRYLKPQQTSSNFLEREKTSKRHE